MARTGGRRRCCSAGRIWIGSSNGSRGPRPRCPSVDLQEFPIHLLQLQVDPGRGMVAWTRFAAHPAVHAGGAQTGCRRLVEQQVIDAQARVAFPVLAEEVPERIDSLLGMLAADGVYPPLLEQALPAGAGLRLQESVLSPGT